VVPAQSVVKVDDGTALDKAALVGCGVTTGYGSAVRTAEVKAGDTVVVMGIGGIGANAVQGARIAGARNIIAIDPVESKREWAMEFGATHTAASVAEAGPVVGLLTRGQMADAFIITTDVAEEKARKAEKDVVLHEAAHIVADIVDLVRSDTKIAARVLPHSAIDKPVD